MKTWGPEAHRNRFREPHEPCFLLTEPGFAVTAQNGMALGESRVSRGGMSWGTRDGLGDRCREGPRTDAPAPSWWRRQSRGRGGRPAASLPILVERAAAEAV